LQRLYQYLKDRLEVNNKVSTLSFTIMPGPKMGPRPADFDEQLVRQSPTYLKWSALADGEKLRYACREFIKGHGDDDERLMRRIMIARRNNIRDHETLKKARRQSIQPLVALPAIPNLPTPPTALAATADAMVDVAPPQLLPALQSAVVDAQSQTSVSSQPDQVMIKMEIEKFPMEASADSTGMAGSDSTAHATLTTAATQCDGQRPCRATTGSRVVQRQA
jgi:hypothetical protein